MAWKRFIFSQKSHPTPALLENSKAQKLSRVPCSLTLSVVLEVEGGRRGVCRPLWSSVLEWCSEGREKAEARQSQLWQQQTSGISVRQQAGTIRDILQSSVTPPSTAGHPAMTGATATFLLVLGLATTSLGEIKPAGTQYFISAFRLK